MGFFLLERGAIDLMRWTEAGAAVRIHAAVSGETFAEASLFSNSYHCDAIARHASTVVRFARSEALETIRTNPEFAIALTTHLSHALRDARRIIELRSVNPLTERLYLRLADIADGAGHLPEGKEIKAVAEEIGATPEACYRALKELEKWGKITRPKRGTIRLA